MAQGAKALRLPTPHRTSVSYRCRHRCWRNQPGTRGVDPAATVGRTSLTSAWRTGRGWEARARCMDARLQGRGAWEQTGTWRMDPGLRASGTSTSLRTGAG